MIALGLNDSVVPIYDRRFTKYPFLRLLPGKFNFKNFYYILGHLALVDQEKRHLMRSSLVTHVAFNEKGDELAVNISCDNIYVFNVRESSTESSPNVLDALNRYLI